MKAILGIDPGLSGALALLDANYGYAGAALQVVDMPTLTITTNGKKRKRIDLANLATWFDLHASSIEKAVIEDVNAMPGQGVSSMFKFGCVFGNLEAFVAAHFIKVETVRPQVWKKHFGLTADKDAARLHASRLLPAFSSLWSRSCDDGRAEAALLALYGGRNG